MNQLVKKEPGTALETFTEKCLNPVFFIAIGYAFGFFHGNSRRKRKQVSE